MDSLLDVLRTQYTNLTFQQGDAFCWSPETNEVIYAMQPGDRTAAWSLLHETSHALLGHTTYTTDFELLKLEVAAWDKAKKLAKIFDICIDEDHVQDCLDSYRDWIYARSICPRCGNKSLQQANLRHYKCFNCHMIWQVTPSRFCRAYRATKHSGGPAIPHMFDALTTL